MTIDLISDEPTAGQPKEVQRLNAIFEELKAEALRVLEEENE